MNYILSQKYSQAIPQACILTAKRPWMIVWLQFQFQIMHENSYLLGQLLSQQFIQTLSILSKDLQTDDLLEPHFDCMRWDARC